MGNKSILVAVLSMALVGCETETVPGGTAPFVNRDPIRGQSKVTHAVNWQELAARSIAALPSAAGGEKLAAYVSLGPDVGLESPFAAVYKQFLEEELLKANYPVLQSADGAGMVIEFDIHPLAYPYTIPVWEGETPAEVVVSTRVSDSAHVHFLHTETVYVRPIDLALYEPGLPLTELPVNTGR